MRPAQVRADDLDMSFEPRCPQCLFVSRELGQPTPCLLHVSLPVEPAAADLAPEQPVHLHEYDEPYVFGQLRPTVDRPGPFSLREYVRLQLLRTRIQADPSQLDQPAPGTQARSLSRR
ncbi:MAG: hypothetical protein JO020_13795 [Chloroflexi bacterium]|nr:hypothetical protein [Chloroflexota bacterium]MBV9895237.1 hypothetical protein [Chloroflexota bacterium]